MGSINFEKTDMNLNIMAALTFAALSAVGNAMFAFGQKRAELVENPFLFLALTMTTCLILFCITIPFFPNVKAFSYAVNNALWIGISGLGFYFTFIGFYFLYTRFGASYYVVYAVFSILTTSIVVGILVFKESFNIYHLLSVFCAIVTVVLFSVGQRMTQS